MSATLLPSTAVLAAGPAAADPMEEAAAVHAEWTEAFNAGDMNKLVALYTRNAMLYGSTATLFKGPEGVRTYFEQLPPGLSARMGEQSVVAVEPNVHLSSGRLDFARKDGTVVSYRLTLALVRVEGCWLIAQHHASLMPKG